MTTLKPCSSTSGQFIDIKKVIGNMRIAALGLDIISLLDFSSKKCSCQTKTRSGPVQILRSDFLDPNLQYFIF